MKYETTQRNTYRPLRHGQWIRDPETGEWGQLHSARVLLWQFVKPAGMWLRILFTLAVTGAMFALFLYGPIK